jgi:hypothetical protein
MKYYGFRFASRPPIFVREREDTYCPTCYRRMWPKVPPTDYHRSLLAIEPITRLAEARAATCCQCQQPLAPLARGSLTRA